MSVGTTSNISTGRGGAGNIGSPKIKPTDTSGQNLDTPHLKGPIYTTGRGGQGNMAKYEAAEARKAQDVDPVVRKDSKVGTTVLTGRGGSGNKHTVRENDEGDLVLDEDSGLQNITSREGRKQERSGSFIGKAKESLDKIRGRSGSARRKGSAGSTSSEGSVRSGK